ncbi:phosphatase PAP2 family protein [Flavobacterium macrobrachii]|uniref:Phosphatase PAP2 family protein n=1 Tax=Flavobacterium macrobrachii TaxID=591204 RepID=A0ABS2CYJ1_9FLAO|nr:phosphatase PAP2 family protein [Flavobacterium macrobrachii]MBM6499649.1 phosphatase PAP2 family protein [Flavobacterium macrobrachii]
MFEKIIDLDKEVLVYLNTLGSETYDGLWLIITKQIYWTPFFLFIFYLLQKKIGWKKFGYYILFTAVLLLICDQTVNLFKYGFERLRPVNDTEINGLLRIVKTSKSFSFFSGHATNSMASTVFMVMVLRKYYKHAYLLFLFPLIFAYSRIYLGLHFPTDILTGYVFGATMGFVCYKLYQKFIFRELSH